MRGVSRSFCGAALCLLIAAAANAQNLVKMLPSVSKNISYQEAFIKINYKPASYEALMQLPDSAILKIEVYPKKMAIKEFGKDEGKNGVVLVTLRKGEMFDYNSRKNDNQFVVGDKGDTIYCQHLTNATLSGDTTYNAWVQFITKNLNANIPVNNSAPPGIFNVDFSFLISREGNVKTVKVFQDPGYGCGAEVKRLMTASPQWTTATCNDNAVNVEERQRITFMVSDK